MTPAEILRSAASNIHPETWCQNQLRTSDGRGCAMWHLEQVCAGRTVAMLDALDAAYRAVPGGSLADWNDDPERTSFDVVELFEQVASKLEAQCATTT